MVFYRKYRPQTIDELDSDFVREKLTSFLSANEIPHAFLFTGPKGLGKTSAARIVAKAVNCEKRNQELGIRNQGKEKKGKTHDSMGIEPCNKCDQCISITNGTNFDVLEIDGASNRGIDEIRDLREKVKLSPVSALKKVYIIDEVHMLTTEAFNALLKTLEEPPSHVLFILCTTEPHKVPSTIISRCSHIAFPNASKDELVRSFERIVKGEGLEASYEALENIALLSDGGFRDGVKILEELAVASKDKKITKELIEEKYQVSSIKYQVSELINYLVERDTKSALGLVSKSVEQGIDMKYFLGQLIGELHHQLLVQVGVEEESSIKNKLLSIEDIKKLVQLFSLAHGELKYTVLPQLPLEMAVIEWGEMEANFDTRGPVVSLPPSLPPAPAIKSDFDSLWQELISKVKSQNHSAAGVLRGCSLKAYNKKEFIIETKFKFHKEKLEEKNVRELIEKVWGDIVGHNSTLQINLSSN